MLSRGGKAKRLRFTELQTGTSHRKPCCATPCLLLRKTEALMISAEMSSILKRQLHGPAAFFEKFCVQPVHLRHTARFSRRDFRIVREYRNTGSKLEVMRRSALGLCSVYNLLPANIVALDSVKQFQSALQRLLTRCVTQRGEEWFHMFSPRCDFTFRMLRLCTV